MMRALLILAASFCALSAVACGGSEPASENASAEDETTVEGRGGDTANWWDALPRQEWSAYQRVLESDPWFEVYKIFPDTFAIYEPGQFEEVISFLIVGETRALLLDTGLGIARLQPVVASLTHLDVTVVNSHSHYDHIGSNYEFEKIAGVDHPYARASAKGAPNEIVGELLRGDWVWKPLPEGVTATNYKINPYALSETIADGDIIDLGGVQLEVIATPGHSPDSICLFDRTGRRLFMGDVFYFAPLYAHLKGSDLGDYTASAEKLAALQPEIDTLITAHNVPVADSSYLSRMRDAFTAIEEGRAGFVETDGAYEYDFEDFSIIAPPPDSNP